MISNVQRTIQDLKDDISIIDFQALVTKNERLKGKAKLIDLWHHQIEEFETFMMEHAFMSTKLLIYQQKACQVRLD
jgi:hypothetical protein